MQMGTIFLSGGGDKKHTEKFNSIIMDRLCHEKPLLYIPSAMDGMVPYSECQEWAERVFVPLGITRIEMWTELQSRNLEELLTFSGLYIGGGNTFALLKHIRECGFTTLLTAYLEKSGTVLGSSAGAIILGEDIGTCAHLDENRVKLKETNGLALLHEYSVWSHYSPHDDVSIERTVQTTGKPVLALSEKTGLALESGRATVTGTFPAIQFRQTDEKVVRQILAPGTAFIMLSENG